MSQTSLHTGDLGDIIASLPTVRALGGAHYVITDTGEGGRRQSMKGARFEAIRPLLEAQPYIHGVEWQDQPKGITHDFSGFRHDGRHGESLAHWQARHLGVEISTAPWLAFNPAPEHAGRVVIARSQRYHGHGFPWKQLLEIHRRPLFVGLKSEHAAFIAEFGPVEYLPTRDLLALAEVIAAAKLFIGNQSSPMWVALGLGVPIIQETWVVAPNTIIPRSNCRYTETIDDLNRLWSEMQPREYA